MLIAKTDFVLKFIGGITDLKTQYSIFVFTVLEYFVTFEVVKFSQVRAKEGRKLTFVTDCEL